MSVGQNIEVEVLSNIAEGTGSLIKAKIIKVPAYNPVPLQAVLGMELQLTTAFSTAGIAKLGNQFSCDEITFDMAPYQSGQPSRIATPPKGHLSSISLRCFTLRVAESALHGTSGTKITGTITDVPHYNSLLAGLLKGPRVTIESPRSPRNFRVGDLATFVEVPFKNSRAISGWNGIEPSSSASQGAVSSAEADRIWGITVNIARGGGVPVPKSNEDQQREAVLGAPQP